MSFNPNYFAINQNYYSADRILQDEPKQKCRGEFSKDRDRIMYSKAFRRLSGKTQIFLTSNIEDIRSRLTHTLEVNQIAKTIGRALGMNIELIEAIALGHDIGHTPFGHVGERTLNMIMNGCEAKFPPLREEEKGFKHNLQGLRILCDLESIDDHKGLNLSKYTLWGIAYHSSVTYNRNCPFCQEQSICHKGIEQPECQKTGKFSCDFYNQYLNPLKDYWSFEGYIVAIADEIAQRHHDIEDALRYNILDRKRLEEELSNFPLPRKEDKQNFKKMRSAKSDDLEEYLRLFSRFIVNLYVVNVIEQTKERMKTLSKKHEINKTNDFKPYRSGKSDKSEIHKIVSFSVALQSADKEFQNLLRKNVLGSYTAQCMDGKGEYIIRRLFDAYMSNPMQLPDDVILGFNNLIDKCSTTRLEIREKVIGNEPILMRTVCDYIAGMTDSYAYAQFDALYGTRVHP